MECRFDDLTGAGAGWVFEGARGVVAARRPEDVPAVLAAVEEANRNKLFAAGFVAYEAAPGLDPALRVGAGAPQARGRPPELPLAWFGLFERRRRAAGPPRPVTAALATAGAGWRWECARSWFDAAVATAQQRIAAGWTYQANVTTRLSHPSITDPYGLYAGLAPAQGGAYCAYLEDEGWAIACASPELFFVRDGDRLVTRPMKGTAARGVDPVADRLAADGLLGSAKERAENVMIVDLLRNDLGRLARYGQVSVPALFELEAYPTVWQMTSTVEARVPAECGLAETFRALFPCGSVTGAPKVATMALLAEVEAGCRGVYCGAVGWSAPAGTRPSQRFAVAIRTAVVDRSTGYAEFGVGSGITAYSTAEREWAELEAKAAVVTRPGTGRAAGEP